MSFDLSQLSVPESLGESLKPMVTCTIEGILDEEDLRELALGCGPDDVKPAEDNPNDLSKIREKHHHVARLVADGMKQRLVAQVCGYTEGYVSILLNNPAMQELVQMYRIQAGAAVKVATEKLKTVGLKALEKLEEAIDADKLNNQELLGAAKLGLDRGGLGPQTKVHQVNEDHIIDHAKLAELNADARRRNHNYIVPVSDVRKALAPPTKDAEDEAA